MAEGALTSTQNMLFRDNDPGMIDSRGTNMDPTRNVGFMEDTTLSEFFQRPLKIYETDWDVSNPLFARFDPWTLFWENPRNLEKLSYYYLLKCTLHVKLLINGNAFYYGRAIMAYEPLAKLDNTSVTSTRSNAYVNQDLVRLSQRMHFYINPTDCSGGALELPFFYPKSSLVIPTKDWREMGDCVIMSLADLEHANGGTDALTISVFAWAENVSYAIPTAKAPVISGTRRFNVPEMGDEHEVGVISRPASTVARYAGALSNIPMIGSFAKATEIGAMAVAAVAKIFGYSSPVNLTYDMMAPFPRPSLAVVDSPYVTNKLSVDSKQEICIDPCTTGIRADDELPIASIAGRESYLESFEWNITDDPDDSLYQIRVDPFLVRANGNENHLPACAAAVLPFKYWRGTMRFRFQIVASAYHKGRIRVVYDPYAGVIGPEYNTHYTTVHDISEEKDFTVDVGWAQDEPYKEHLQYGVDTISTTSKTVPLQRTATRGNGVVGLYVLNKLTTPGTVVANIKVNVFVSMLDDFEVGMPSAELCNWSFRNPAIQPAARNRNVPEMGEEDDADCCDDVVTDPPVIDTFADTLIDSTDTTKLFFGEVIGSYRQLMKRTSLIEVYKVPQQTDNTWVELSRRAFPEFGGVTTLTRVPNSMALEYSTGTKVVPTNMSYINYVSRMFLGWRGSLRWTFDTSTLNVTSGTDQFNSISATISRTDTTQRTSRVQSIPDPTTLPINTSVNYLNNVRFDSIQGAFIGNTGVNPIQSVEVPFYSNKRFLSTNHDESFIAIVEEPSFKFECILPGATDKDISLLKLYCSAGEDFNLFYFNGLPPIWRSNGIPLDPGSPPPGGGSV